MLDIQDPEDRLIRLLLIWGGVLVVAGTIVSIVISAALISANYNILNWLE